MQLNNRFHDWLKPNVYREITFENAEELTEEGLPFLILFHSPDDVQSIKDYKTIVETQLITEKREKQI